MSLSNIPSNVYNPTRGTSFTVRILPSSSKKLCVATRYHRFNNDDYTCHRVLKDGKWVGNCVICDKYNESFRIVEGVVAGSAPSKYKGDMDAFKNDVRSIKPIDRYYFNVIARDELARDDNLGPMIWSCGQSLYQIILRGIVGDPSNSNVKALGDVTHPKTGNDLQVISKLVAVGTTPFPNLSDSFFRDSSRLGNKKQIDKWLGSLWDLHEIPNQKVKDDSEMVDALNEFFGPASLSKFKPRYRSINDEWSPSWQ